MDDDLNTANKKEKALLYVVADRKFVILEYYIKKKYTLHGIEYVDTIEKTSEVSLSAHDRYVDIDADRAFIAEGASGVEVFDVSDPKNMRPFAISCQFADRL